MASTWWRWPLVPVAAVAAGLGAALPPALVNVAAHHLGLLDEGGWFLATVAPVVGGIAFGVGASWAAIRVAPKAKNIAAACVFWMLLVLSLIDVTLAARSESMAYSFVSALQLTAMLISVEISRGYWIGRLS